jgi:SAM-dependent methyltransferase
MTDDPRAIWEGNAAFWDATVGAEGNDFHRLLVAPAQMRLLALRPGERVLEIACGNGQFAREMARAGASVLATDFAQAFLDIAIKRGIETGVTGIEYHRVDATDEQALLALGAEGPFDAAVATMAIHDIATIEPLMRALREIVRDDGRVVFSVTHPCFNGSGFAFVTETEDRDGTVETTYAVKVRRYLTAGATRGTGVIGQPQPHWYFDRPLSVLLAPCFAAGFAVDAMLEPAFPGGLERPDRPFGWRNYSEIPPVLVVRLVPIRRPTERLKD